MPSFSLEGLADQLRPRPGADREDRDAERLAVLGQAMMITALVVTLPIALWVLLTGRSSPDPIGVVGFLIIETMALVAIRARRMRLAGWIFTAGAIAVTTWVALISAGGVDSPAFAVYFILVISAGMMRGGRSAARVAASCIAIGLLLVVLETTGRLPSLGVQRPPLTYWVVHSTVLALTAAYIGLSMRGLDAALARARVNRLAMEAATDGMAVRDGHHLAYVNTAHAHMHGWPDAASLIGQPCHVLFGDREWDRITQEVLPVLSTDGAWQGEAIALRRDGSEFPIETTMTRIDDQRMVSVVRDISERRAAELMLRRTQKLDGLAVMAGGIAHDFNNLLTAMLGHMTLARRRIGAGESADSSLAAAQASAERAADLTQQLLRYAGRAQVRISPLDLNELVGENGRILATMIPPHVTLHTELAAEPLVVDANRSGLQQTVMNLVLNAVESIPPDAKGGWVRMRAAACSVPADLPADGQLFGQATLPPGPYAGLEVLDNGIGMSPDVLERIFDPFFTTKAQGNGLGLSATVGIIRELGGVLEVLTSPGEGSRFRVLLPISTARDHPPASRPSDVMSGTVLVVDDEEHVRVTAKDVLGEAGMHVVTAADGKAALACLEQVVIDLVLLDYRMPVMDGEETIAGIRARPNPPPVLLSSGNIGPDAAARLAAMPGLTLLPKPWRREELLAAVAGALPHRPQPAPEARIATSAAPGEPGAPERASGS
jgi:PAS domain S-box-containing protein